MCSSLSLGRRMKHVYGIATAQECSAAEPSVTQDRFPDAVRAAVVSGHIQMCTMLILQQCCLRICIDCREVTRVRVRVVKRGPKSLWSDTIPTAAQCSSTSDQQRPDDIRADCNSSSPLSNGLASGRTRIPRPFVVSMVWECAGSSSSTIAALHRELPAELRSLTFGRSFNLSIDEVNWPASLKELVFGEAFSQPIGNVLWPPDLARLEFGTFFNQPLTGVVWPRGLKEVSFGAKFDKPLHDGVKWPPSLESVTLGEKFSCSLASVRCFPRGLRALTLRGNFPGIFQEISLPEGLEELSLFHFNQPLDGALLPSGLRQLTVGGLFNRPVDRVVWPTGLERLTFGDCFNQPMLCAAETLQSLPAGLERLTFGRDFNQPIVDGATMAVWLPAGLRELSFGDKFNQEVVGVSWPTELRRLSFGEDFNREVEAALWPECLEYLSFPGRFSQPVAGAAWPPALRHLSFGNRFDQPLGQAKFPAGLEILKLGAVFKQPIDGMQLPAGLKCLVVGQELAVQALQDAMLPDGLKIVRRRRSGYAEIMIVRDGAVVMSAG